MRKPPEKVDQNVRMLDVSEPGADNGTTTAPSHEPCVIPENDERECKELKLGVELRNCVRSYLASSVVGVHGVFLEQIIGLALARPPVKVWGLTFNIALL